MSNEKLDMKKTWCEKDSKIKAPWAYEMSYVDKYSFFLLFMLVASLT